MSRGFDADDAWHFAAGTHLRLWDVMGSIPGDAETTFRVWAPNASEVSVVSARNAWRAGVDVLDPDMSGVWRRTFPGYGVGDVYKYAITSGNGVRTVPKADPFAHYAQLPPETASIIAAPTHEWGDADWMANRAGSGRHDGPMSTYEVHLGSWRYEPGGYTAMGRQLAEYCVDMGFTHVELLPITEHPYYGSWGYQTTGYYAPTSRYGEPHELMALVDTMHRAGVGVLLDWVPSHFPTDEASLGYFAAPHLFHHAAPRQGFHPDWKSFVFNYGRGEVRSFLLSSAHYWLDQFHIDGLRVDAVASMLYLDYSREDDEWIPNRHGGNENLEAVEFLQELNRSVYATFPSAVMIAEESTAWPGVSNATDQGGLGFGFKWDMGWMHDTLDYLSTDPLGRKFNHDKLTFRAMYAGAENYVLPLSHDEVVHGKGSLLTKMPGDRHAQFANLRLLLGYQWTTPGKKLLFMGGEFGSPIEWNHEAELPWGVLGEADHAGVQGWVRRLNELYSELPALHEVDRDPSGFRWVVGDDDEQSVLAYVRLAGDDADPVLVIMNNTPVARSGYRLGVPSEGNWELAANSDDTGYGGDGTATISTCVAGADGSHGFHSSVEVDLPPLALLIYVGATAPAV